MGQSGLGLMYFYGKGVDQVSGFSSAVSNPYVFLRV